MNNLMWWGYLHSNGTIQLKRWFGDHEDYTGDCEGNDFVQKVCKPFEATDRADALNKLSLSLGVANLKEGK